MSQTFEIAVLPGDGIGVDVTLATLEVLRAAQQRLPEAQFEFIEYSVGAAEFLKNGDPLPQAAVDGCRRADAVLLGAMGLPSVRWPDGRELTPQIDLREILDLYCGLRPVKLYHGNDTPLKGYAAGELDLLVIRENCEGLFSSRLQPRDLSAYEATDTMKITRRGAERIIRSAFEQARKRRKHVTLVDKANVLPSMVYFRSVFDEIAREYPDIGTDRVYVDAAALFLVKNPKRFDVLVTENMFGDILSDLTAGLVGGMGMAPSADIGDECAVFQPCHGTAPDIAGKGIANPIATILSAVMMLEWLDTPATRAQAEMIERAVATVYADPTNRTPDLGGKLTTGEMTQRVIAALSTS